MRYYQWSSWSNKEKLASQPLHYLAAEPRGDEDILFFVLNWKLSSSCSLSWKLALIKKSSSGASNLSTARRTNPTWLIFCLWNGKTKIFRFVTPWRTLSKKILCSFMRTGWLPSTIAVYKAPTYPTLNNQMCQFFRSRYSFSRLFRHRSSLRRA